MRVMPVRAMRNGQEDLFTSPGGGDAFPRAPLPQFLSNSLDSNTSYEDIDGDNNRKCLRSPFVSEEDLDSRMFIEGEPLSMLFTQNLDLNNDILNMKKPIAKDNWQHMSADSLNENYQLPVTTGKANVAAMLKSHPSPNTANGNMEALQETSITSDTVENGLEEESGFEYTKLNEVTDSDELFSHDSTTPKEGRNGNVRMYSFPKYSDDFAQNIAVEMLQRQGGGLHSSLEVNCSNSVNASPWSDSHSSYESNDSYNDAAYGHDSAFLWEGVDEYCHTAASASGEEFQLAIHRLSASCPKMDRLRCRDRHSYPPCVSSQHGYTVIVDGFENGDLQHSISYPVATMKTPEGYYLQAPLNSHKYRLRNRRRESKSRGRAKSTMEAKTPSPFNLKKSKSKSYEKLSSEIFARWSMESSGFSKSHGNSSHSNCSSLVDDGLQTSPPSVTRAHSFGSADLNRKERPTVSRAHSMSSADRSLSPASKLKKDTWKQRCIRSKSFEKLSLRPQSASDEDFCANPEIVCPAEDSEKEVEPKTPDTAKRVTFAEIAQRKKNMSLPVQPLIESCEIKDRLDTGKHSDEGVFSGEWTEGGNVCEEKRRWSEKERKERLNSEGIELDEEEEDDGIIENASGNEVAMEESLKLRRESLESEKGEEASGRSRLFSDPGPKMTSEVILRDNDSKPRPLKARPHSLPIRPYALAFPLSGQMPRVRRVQKCPSLKTFNGMSRPLAQRSLSCSPYRSPAPPIQILETQKKPLAALRQFQGGGVGSSNSQQYFPLAHQQPPKSADYQITHHHAKGFGNHDNQLLPRSAGYHSNHVTPKWEFHGNLRFEKAVVKEKIQPLFRSALDVHKRGIKVSVVSPGNRGIPVTVSSYQLPAMKGWQKDGDAEEEMTSYVAIETPPDNIPLSPSCSGEFILVDLRRKKALVSAVNSAVDAILGHFGEAREPSAKARLGNSSKTPNIGHLVLRYLCPAVLALVQDGLRPFLRNPIVGRVKNNVWNVVEASTQMGPATKSLHKLFNHLSKTGQMWDINMRFNAFICGLLNLKAVELWLTHLQARYDIVQKHYIPEAFLTLSYTAGRQLFDDVVVIVQPLSLLPFALDTQFEFNIKQEEMEREIGKQRLKEEAARTSPRSTFQMMTGKRVPRYQPSRGMEEEKQEQEEVMVIDRRAEETPVDQDQTPKEEVDSVAGEDQQPTEQPKNQNWWFQLMNSTPVEAAADRKTSQTTSTVSEAGSEPNTTSVRSKLWLRNLIGAGPRPNQEARSKVKVTQEVKQEDEQKPPNGRKSRWASFSSSFIQAVDRVLLPTSSRAGQTPPPSPRQHHGNQTPPESPRQQHNNQTPHPSPRQLHSNQTPSPRQQHSNQMPHPSSRQHHSNQTPPPSPRQLHSNQTPSPRQCHSNQTTWRDHGIVQAQRKVDKRVVKALCHHLATEDGQLSLTKGDILTVVRQVDADWLLCCHGDKTGLVLTGCVNDLDLL